MAIGGLTDRNVATTASCELYDPATGTWKVTAPLDIPSENIAGITLPNGKVFVAGGLDANSPVQYLDFAEIFDPTTETFTRLPEMGVARTGLLLFYNSSLNELMVCGGVYDGFYGHYCLSTVVYSFAKNSWSLADSSIEPHDNSQIMAVETLDGKPLLISGRTGPDALTTNVEAFDWATSSWTHVGNTLAAHWHCYAFQIGDSILLVGGNMPDFTNAVSGCTWYRTSDNSSWAGPSMNVARFSYTGLVYSLGISPCQDSLSVFVFGGSDTNDNPLESCEVLTLGIKPNDTENFASSLSLPSASPTILQSTCSAVDTSIGLGIIGCGSPNGRLDSVWLSSSAGDNASPFTITDARKAPRTLVTSDSILLSYASTHGPDTAELHLRYDLGSGIRDTTITIIGQLASPLLAQSQRLHRESASAYFGAVDTLPLIVDISSAINLDSLWPYLTEIQATYAWDSSVATYAGYNPPAGWTLNTLANHRNSLDI
ncbi:MAG: Kelch repeat-containing protein, partial [Candidatus Kapaibacterium sp.]